MEHRLHPVRTVSGHHSVPDTRQSGTFGDDGAHSGSHSFPNVQTQQVSVPDASLVPLLTTLRPDCKSRTKYFAHGRLDWDEKSSAARYVKENCKPLNRYVLVEHPEHLALFDLINRMLEYEASSRVTLAECLRHPFFDKLPGDHRLHERDFHHASSSSTMSRSHSMYR